VLPDLAPDEASLRSLFATFVVPAAVHV
jgi:hypothetical protein